MPVNASFATLLLLLAVALGFMALLAYAAAVRYKTLRMQRNSAAITTALLDYFQRTGVAVSVGCVSLGKGDCFTVFIESEPMKRFRLSHIIEITLRDHVLKACGLKLEKIYWRFPIKEMTAPAPDGAGQDKNPASSDDYINEGLVHYRDIPKFEATEIPWEKFAEASSGEPAEQKDVAP